MKRREFLQLATASIASLASFKVFRKTSNSPLSNIDNSKQAHWGMVIDIGKCTGCEYCINACQASNDVNPDISWNKIYPSQEKKKKTYTTVACQHCEHAPCVSVCPVGASYYRDDGIVMMDYERCIGCRYCQVACPYGARSFNWESFDGPNPLVPEWGEPDVERRARGLVEKCSFCYQRIDRGLAAGLTPGEDKAATPACVNACPNDARFFGDLNAPDSTVSRKLDDSASFRLLENLGTGPRVHYISSQSDVSVDEL